jgi:UDP-N-acetylmuramoylalanine--D-glutamate ligase
LRYVCGGADADVYDAAVVEVSSYQMQLSGTFCPDAAVVINLTPDHLERHGRYELRQRVRT